MSLPFLPKLRPAGCGEPGAEIDYSCLFSRAASQYLTRTPAAEGNRQKWAFSTWVRRGALDAAMGLFGVLGWGTYYGRLTSSVRFGADNRIYVQGATDAAGGGVAIVQTADTALFRDPAAWMHLLLVFDTTQASGSSGVRISVNGKVLGTVVGYWAQNTLGYINSTHAHYLGRSLGSQTTTNEVYYLDGYMAETAFFDGRVDLVPEDFGYTNRFGVWVPKKFAGKGGGAAIYGAQGWHLDFADPLDLGRDVSGNGNHWTASGLTPASQVTDTPTHGASTITPLARVWGTAPALSEGNRVATFASAAYGAVIGDMPVRAGRWYYEAEIVAAAANADTRIGVADAANPQNIAVYIRGSSLYQDILALPGSVSTATGRTLMTGDRVGITYDLDQRRMWVSVNGVDLISGGVALPASFSGFAVPYLSQSSSVAGASLTVRLRTAPVQIAYRPASALTLITPDLPCPPIKHPERYFTTRLRSAGAAVADLPWSPLAVKTLVVSKRLDAAADWRVNDSLRPGRAWATNTAAADFAEAGGLTFTDTGYTIGAAAAYQGNRVDTIWRAAPAAGFDMLLVDHVTGAPTTVPHAVGGPVDYAWVVPLAGGNRRVYHRSLAAGQYVALNAEFVPATDAGWFASSAVDVTLGASLPTGRYALYLWRAVPQFSAFGSYTGNGALEGPFIPTDFAAGVVMERNLASTNQTYVLDTSRSPDNPLSRYTMLGYDYAEGSGINFGDVVANGIKLRSTATVFNGSGHACLYAAWAKTPLKFGRAR